MMHKLFFVVSSARQKYTRTCYHAIKSTNHAFGEPPGIRDGPYLAPSSPPETPDPTNKRFLASNISHRLIESVYSEFPPSIIISPD